MPLKYRRKPPAPSLRRMYIMAPFSEPPHVGPPQSLLQPRIGALINRSFAKKDRNSEIRQCCETPRLGGRVWTTALGSLSSLVVHLSRRGARALLKNGRSFRGGSRFSRPSAPACSPSNTQPASFASNPNLDARSCRSTQHTRPISPAARPSSASRSKSFRDPRARRAALGRAL
jgi:hypothetical protein